MKKFPTNSVFDFLIDLYPTSAFLVPTSTENCSLCQNRNFDNRKCNQLVPSYENIEAHLILKSLEHSRSCQLPKFPGL